MEILDSLPVFSFSSVLVKSIHIFEFWKVIAFFFVFFFFFLFVRRTEVIENTARGSNVCFRSGCLSVN